MNTNIKFKKANAFRISQEKLRNKALSKGVNLVAPETIFLNKDTVFGKNVTVEPYVVFGPKVKIGDNSYIKSFSHIEGTTIEKNVIIGPYARLREGTILKSYTKIGNFVETKKTSINSKSKVNHLSYIGDTIIGKNANIGAGTITCNFNGIKKFKTNISDNVFVGSNSSLIAPVKLERNSVVGAGSVITKNVKRNSLGISRPIQIGVKNYKRKNKKKIMCGIIGIASNKPVSISIINSLKKLEYRGYDSAGLATLNKNEIDEKKCSGRVEELEKILFKKPSNGNLGIGHVRWATHGVPNIINAHPHSSDIVSVVHNGIIENSDEIKTKLEKKGIKFKSQTDTEVITLLITEALQKEKPLESVFKTLKLLKGSFALGIIFKNYNDIIIGARRGSPLAVGYSKEENYLGSDSYALKSMTNKISYLDDGDLCIISKDKVEFFNENKRKINKKVYTLSDDQNITEKGDYKNFMSKEIFEQPITAKNCINEYIDNLKRDINIYDFPIKPEKINKIVLIGCGTAYHSCLVAKYWFEEITDLSLNYRYIR